jgi:lysine-specific permease
VAQGFKVSELAYSVKLFPVGPIVSMVIGLFMANCRNPESFENGEWGHIVITDMSVILALVLYGVYKYWKKTKLMPLLEINFRVGTLQSGLIEGRESRVGPSVEST